MSAMEFILTVPPSTNRIWAPVRTRTGARLVKRSTYADWSAQAAREIGTQRAGQCLLGAFRVAILLPEGRYDGDNIIKPLIDACQAGGAIANDRYCVGGTWDLDDTRQGTVLVHLTPIPPLARAQRNTGTARMETV